MSKARRSSRKSSQSVANRGSHPTSTRRRVAVLVSLVGVLTFTSALLLALAPAPLNSQAASSLFAIDAPQSFDVVFETTSVPLQSGRWQSIYIHHSGGISGSAQSLAESPNGLADHFVIGNGDGCNDGEVQIGQRWIQQQSPGRSLPDYVGPDSISICLIGDFNQARPTPTQQRRLVQLVSVLQGKLHIPRSRVHAYFDPQPGSAAGIGAYFPANDLLKQILP